MSTQEIFVRDLHPGMGQAVAERTVLRKKEDGTLETWSDVAHRVALGNSLLCSDPIEQKSEYELLKKHLSKATTLMSGRHLQHGDETQPNRNMEVFTNCATANSSFAMFYLLLNGAGVGRSYDDDLMLVDWDNAPTVRCVIDENHKDYDYVAHETVREAKHKYGTGKKVIWHTVGDTREGWAKALEVLEVLAFEKINSDKMLILDFSEVRCKGSLIAGMQNRPASGPVPLMNAFNRAATLKGSGLEKWMQTLYVDHYFADCVLVGGARRAARMSVKYWKDSGILEFITIKRPIEFYDKSAEDIIAMRKKSPFNGFLWTSNNSILVDEEFWKLLEIKKGENGYTDELTKKARAVFKSATEAAYADGTGEPGFINIDKLNHNLSGIEKFVKDNNYFGSKKYQINEDTEIYVSRLLKKASKKKYPMIVNPCSEIVIATWGAFCTIGNIVPCHCDTIDEFEEAARTVVRALIRVNTMDSIYKKEVQRTNRIGIGLTGVHEYAWKFFKLTFKDLLDEEKSQPFWQSLLRVKKAVQDEAVFYANKIGVVVPHTDTEIAPTGTVSKLFGLTEGWHLPSMLWYIRWVQFSNTDPLIEKYKEAGYPVKVLKSYNNTTIVGFPTVPVICNMNIPELITAAQATPEEQYKWLLLGEKYWIRGIDVPDTGNQISYTLKYSPEVVDYKTFAETIRNYQSKVKCCSVMPQEDKSSYEYLPEQPVSRAEYENICRKIEKSLAEDVDRTHVDCASGACPIDFKDSKKEQ